jgi:hypothetical protein
MLCGTNLFYAIYLAISKGALMQMRFSRARIVHDETAIRRLGGWQITDKDRNHDPYFY